MRWLDRRYALLSVPRYTPYRDALLALARQPDRVRVAEIAGNRVVTFTGTVQRDWQRPDRCTVVTAYASPTAPGAMRALIAVDARDLLNVLADVTAHGFAVDHIYDY